MQTQTAIADVATDSLVSAMALRSALYQKFQGYQFKPLLVRLQRELGIRAEEAQQLFTDLKTWMFLCAVSDKPLSPPKIIDEAWHNFVLFTKEYASFCQGFCGRFVHHVPFDGVCQSEESESTRTSAHQNTLNLIASLGLSGKNWLMGSSSSCCDGGNCSNSPGGCSHCSEG